MAMSEIDLSRLSIAIVRVERELDLNVHLNKKRSAEFLDDLRVVVNAASRFLVSESVETLDLRTLSDDDIQRSPLEDVDDLDNKENI